VHDELGCAESALADLCRAVALAPDDPDLLYNRAHVLRGLGRSDAALRDLNAAAALAPEDPDVRDALLDCLTERSTA
jgi:Flp pilus assembly protein TadD